MCDFASYLELRVQSIVFTCMIVGQLLLMTGWCFHLWVGVEKEVEKKKKETRDCERLQIEISSAANALALCTRLVCLTALCAGSWIHCIHAHVVLTASKCMQWNKELHRHGPLLPGSPAPSLSTLFSLGRSLAHINRERESEGETKPSYCTHLHSISVWVGSRWIRQNTKWPTYTLRRDK